MPVGEPGGPDTEMFYDFKYGEPLIHTHNDDIVKYGNDCDPNCDCGRFVEIGNNVFIQYKKTKNGMEELKQKNVDFGGGLERLTAATRDDADVFNLDVYDKAKKIIEELSGLDYDGRDSVKQKYRVILDHIRAATFLIGDGVLPGNKDREYFVRRLIRRAVRYGRVLNINDNFTKDIAESFIDYYQYATEYIGNNGQKNKSIILEEIEKEEIKFRKTLELGLKEFDKICDNVKKMSDSGILDPNECLNGKVLFDLYQTYGFPFELSIEEIKNKENELTDFIKHYGVGETSFEKVLQKDFNKLKEEHSKASKTASVGMFKGGLADDGEITTALHSTTHIMLAGMRDVLGDTVHQAGSNINAERLRFDFTFDRKLEETEVKSIEDYVNNAIQEGFVVETEDMNKNKAKEEGVEGAF
ncbi:MAG: alanine--tRNA ligase-related protein [Candidatus Pacebacteria bacterium]|nr:alanine--tRNA ligase-related protein [Candidatus Paceibacterota bacterium]